MFLVRVTFLLALACGEPPPVAPEPIAAVYHPDTPFPQFLPLWLEGWARLHAAGESLPSIQDKNPLGGHVHLYLRNTSGVALDECDVLIDGVSLQAALTPGQAGPRGFRPTSIHFSSLPAAEQDRLKAAGEPVWWKVEPRPIPAGGYGEVVIRLRRRPQCASFPLRVLFGPVVADARAEINGTWPQIAGIAFAPARGEATLYVRDLPDQSSISRCWVDDADCTPASSARPSSNSDTLPVVIRLPRPVAVGSWHLFQVELSNGAVARAGIRAWADELVYGMWGYTNAGQTPEENARLCLTDLCDHHINVHMGMAGDWGPFIGSAAGADFLRTIGMRMMVQAVGETSAPAYYLLMDEPDAHDHAVSQLPPAQRLGTLAQALVGHGDKLRRDDAATPQLLNVDNTYKPENWYMYGQLPDVLASDPYYQEQLALVYGARPGWLAHFVKPTMVYATATVCRSAAEPRPVHIILNAVRHDHPERPFRFATPVEKRIELYYALAGGAKGFSYWWYAPYDEYFGVGGADPEAAKLWREIGLLGAEMRTAGPVIMRSCPAIVPVKHPPRLWLRTLLAGLDTLVLIVVNDNHAVDRAGTVVCPVEQATVAVSLPGWLEPKSAFEITYAGPQAISWTRAGNEVSIDLGTVEVTRLVLLTANEHLRAELDDLYRSRFAGTVTKLLCK